MKASLAALQLLEPDAWLEQVPRVLQASGYQKVKNGKGLRCWRDEWVHTRGSMRYTDGFQLTRLWTGRDRGALGILPKRIYLDGDGHADIRPERTILNGNQLPNKTVAEILSRQSKLLSDLQQADCTSSVVDLDNLSTELHHSIRLHAGNGSIAAGGNLRMFLHQHGFHSVPDELRAAVIPENESCTIAAADYVNRLTDWFRERGQSIRVSLSSCDKLDTRLSELERGAAPSTTFAPVIFMLDDKGQAASSTLLECMRRLDKIGLPWRRANRSDDRNWSVEDQLGSLVNAAGGLPYFVSCADDALPWAIGIDISHPRDAGVSVACAALTDPGGNLVQAWTIRQPRNEAMQPEHVRKLVDAAERKVIELDSDPNILIIRDGRMFERENVRTYIEDSVGRATLLELRKGGNPLILLDDGTKLPQYPSVAFVPATDKGKHVAFMITNPDVNSGFAQVLKLSWQERWNNIGLPAEQMPAIVCALSYAPGLGLHRHTLPAPVYWADGIAGAHDDDLRFRGQRVVQLQ